MLILYTQDRCNWCDRLKEKLKEFFEDSDMPSLPFFNLDTEEGLLDRLDYDFGYVGGVVKRRGNRTP